MSRRLRKLLIANRGEIAVRVAATAHRMGLGTVGLYAEPDANAPHVDAVDRAVALGGATPADSYLRTDAVLKAALENGCDAVHPGYGFLAENPDFAQQVVDAGLVWVGPSPQQIASLGDKIRAKQIAAEAGVPTASAVRVTPGEPAPDVALPILVKAAAGGGGRGMRVVRTRHDLEDAVEAASREAASAFGDGTVFLEPFIEKGRHVEVQIMGDRHGSVIHLGDRECSIQRRNQKILEEAPSAGITAETRQALLNGAVALAKHVGYDNAGTVEFLVAADGTVSFLEVNARLQVEHPVTEAVTGLDLVELQLKIAAGEPLPVTQDDVTFAGHAIEVRLVAEDPAAGWLPSTGRIERFDIGGGVRVDSGVRAGTTITPDYDSLVAKVIAHAPTRGEAAARLARSLRTAAIVGPRTNVASLVAVLEDEHFAAAETPTSYLDDHPDVVAATGPEGDDRVALLLGAVFAAEQASRSADPATGFAPSGWRNLRTTGQRQLWQLGDEELHVEYVMRGSGAALVMLGVPPAPGDDGSLPEDARRRIDVRLLDRSSDRQVVELDGVRHVVTVSTHGSAVHTASRAGSLTWTRRPRFEVHDTDEAGSGPVCPLPGTVIAVYVDPGQSVGAGDVLMVVEAMKMEHKITTVAAATVAEVRYAVGDRVDAGDLLVRLDSE